MSQHESTWVVVADASGAQVLATDEHLRRCKVVTELSHPESRTRGRTLMADDRGRTRPRNKDAARGSAVAYKTPPQQVEAEAFSRELAEYLRVARARNRYRQVILAASPAFLGLLREALDAPTRACVRGSVAKNLTAERPEHALVHLRGELDLP